MALTKVPSNLDSVTATTQSQGDNSTNVATTAYVDTGLNALIDSAPGNLNTLNELAAAMNDNASFFSTVLPLSGGTMTGDLILGDSVQIELGAASGGDLRLYHDGSNSHIKNVGSPFYIATEGSGNDLYLRADDDIFIQPQGGENGIKVIGNSSVELYYDNDLKLLTSSTGINLPIDGEAIKFGADSDVILTHEHDIGLAVTGDLTASGLYVGSRNATFDFYNNGTSYLNGQVTIDDQLTLSSSSARVIIGTGFRMDDNGTTNAGRLGFNRNPADGAYLSSSSYQRFQMNGPGSSGDFLDIQNYNSSGGYEGSLRMENGDVRLQSQKAGHTIFKVTGSYADGYRHGVEVANTHTGGLTHSIFSTNNSDGFFSGGKFVIANETMGDVDANTAGMIQMDSSGNVHVSQNQSGVRIYLGSQGGAYGVNSSHNMRASSNLLMMNAGGSSGQFIVECNGSNRGSVTTSTSFVTSSDERIKKDIVDMDKGLAEILQLKPKKFKYNIGTIDQYGFIAQEVEEIVPDLITESVSTEDGVEITDFKSLSYNGIFSILVKAVQEQQTIIEDLKSRIETLEG